MWNTLFSGWRRKFGVALLLLAAGLTGLWMRSLVYADAIHITRIRSNHQIRSRNGMLTWECDRPIPGRGEQQLDKAIWHWQTLLCPDPALMELIDNSSFCLDGYMVDSLWMWGPFLFGSGTELPIPEPSGDIFNEKADGPRSISPIFPRRHIWRVPFWGLVLLLTLGAAVLILVRSKPQCSVGETQKDVLTP